MFSPLELSVFLCPCVVFRMGKEEKHEDADIVSEDRLQGKQLENVQKSYIKPSTATPSEKEWLELAVLDLIWVHFYTPVLCFYKLTPESSVGVVQQLKDTLADALVLFYPLAGRVFGPRDGRPASIHCNDAGALFFEASVDIEMAVLKTEDFQPQMKLSGLPAAGFGNYPSLPHVEDGLPALIIQVTHFKCGGITVGINWSHAAGDGRAGFHFLKSWSEIARGLEVTLLPDHRRAELLKPSEPLPEMKQDPFISSMYISPGAHLIAGKVKPPPKDGSDKVAILAPKTIEFTKDEIAMLKKKGMEKAEQQLSRADCLSNHILRNVARVRNLQAESPIRLCVLVEGRKQLSLPPGYFGNAISMLCVVFSGDEVLNQPFSTTANVIHKAVATVITRQWYQNMINFITYGIRMGTFRPVLEDERFPGMKNVSISYLNRFPYYELDFGFGIPAYSVRNTMGAREGLFFVLPSPHGKEDLSVMANMDSDHMPGFLSMVRDIPE